MKLNILCFSIFLIFRLPLSSQTITIEFPKFAGKAYDFLIFQGSRQVKIYQNDTIPNDGMVTIKIPDEYAPYVGMCRWFLSNGKEGGGLDMAIPGHDFRVFCNSSSPDENNIVWDGYDAQNELNRLSKIQKVFTDKFEALGNIMQVYDTAHFMYPLFIKEKEENAMAYKLFIENLKFNPNYNARFLPIVNLTHGLSDELTDDYVRQSELFNAYITHKLNFDYLYTSGHWKGIIQSWVQLHVNVKQDAVVFATDFKIISQRISDPKKFTDFVERVTYYCTLYKRDDFINSIAPAVLQSGKITSFAEKNLEIYAKAVIGTIAPDLILNDDNVKMDSLFRPYSLSKGDSLGFNEYKSTLLVFYQSGCGACDDLMFQLQSEYDFLKAQGVRIISISADLNESAFKSSSQDFPWIDNYCDFKGTSGVNFSKYAVTGTPTLILIDNHGIIKARGATLYHIYDGLKGLLPVANINK